ncbi:MAG: hypothetical protein SOW31_08030 [Treponema sp.]|nr:hypothetical protein [Spirochaetia bacterium]MDY3131661.1 hypothetical protein [Treponema sp.]
MVFSNDGDRDKMKNGISNDGDRDKKSRNKKGKIKKTVPIKNIKTDTFNVYRYFIY